MCGPASDDICICPDCGEYEEECVCDKIGIDDEGEQ